MEEDSQFENEGIQSGEPLIGGVRLKQILDSLETGDLLPEADIVCNIVDKLERNINIAACLIQFANYTQNDSQDHFLVTKKDYQSPSLKSALGVFTNLYSNLKRREEGVLDDSYDGDADAEDPVPSGEKKRKKKVGVSKKKSPLAIKLKGDEQGIKADKLQFLVRDVIFYIVKDYRIELANFLENTEKDSNLSALGKDYLVFREHARPLVTRSRDVTVKEAEILVEKIMSRQKLEKVRDKLNEEVDFLKAAQKAMVEEKEKEGNELKASIEESNAESQDNIEQIRRKTQNNIKRLEWESNQRQIEMKEKILLLVGSRKDLCSLHWVAEREARHKNTELETSVKDLLIKYDEEMFESHHKIQDLEEKYGKEKEELDKVEARLAVIEAEKEIILSEQRAEEDRIRNEKLDEIRLRRAAITLQRAWRQHKVLQQQSKKKKKGKKKIRNN
eukprot:TRINITY_DN46320_c0_g1_i1.p1 TRINITY_DN46320_c0_g1~~TRINITY_DN46320_c0_g1_i1.p1  ORF type:complete len:446 (-),score=177.95 TRINITY_DN46320_c0_g1_i1:9-1346(-)